MASERIGGKVVSAIVATGLLSFSGVIVETAMNIAFPTLMKEFSISTELVSWLTTIYLLVLAIVVPLSALLKSNFKTKHLFIVANLCFLGGVIIDIISPNFYLLLLGRAIQGLGTGIALPLMFNIIMEQVPLAKRGLMMGLGNLITGIAPAVGPTFGGLIVTTIGWRFIFICLIPVLLASLLLGSWAIEQASPLVKQKLDQLSLLLIILMFSGLIYGFNHLSSAKFVSWQVLGSLIVGGGAASLLVWWSNKSNQPLLDLRLLSGGKFKLYLLAFFLTQLMSLGFAFLLPNYLQIVNQQTAFAAGLLVLPAGFLGAVAGLIGGRLFDKYGARLPLLSGAISYGLATGVFVGRGWWLPNHFIMLAYCLYMLGMGLTMGAVMTVALESVKSTKTKEANALLNTVQQFAGALGTAVVSTIVAVSQASQQGSFHTATARGTHYALLLLLVLALSNLCLYLGASRRVPKP